MNDKKHRPKANVLGMAVDAVDMEGALRGVAEELESGRKGYVCLAGVYGAMEAHRNADLAEIWANASLVPPDGMPMVWVGRHQGHRGMERVAGPDLMLEVMRREEFGGYTHFLCGGKEGVALELETTLRKRFPLVKIVGSHTPPFGPMSALEEEGFVEQVNRLRPDIIWVGISTPKQDRFMAQYLPLLDTKLMFGVGAAFDFHTGRIADCAEWIKQSGLQWLHRLVQDPKHLWRRNLHSNPAFVWAVLLQLTGLKSYSLPLERRSQPSSEAAMPTSLVESQSR